MAASPGAPSPHPDPRHRRGWRWALQRLTRFRRSNVELVYSRRYQLRLPGVAADPMRGEHILAYLAAERLTALGALHTPEPVTYRQLRRVHTDEYIDSLTEPGALLQIVGLDLPDPLPDRILEAQRRMAGGTLLAARLALSKGLAINLGGGLHHAFADRGQRFCVWNDVAIAIRELRDGGFAAPILVVDLDLHDGDGTRSIFAGDTSVHVLTIHNQTSTEVPVQGATVLELGAAVADETYLDALAKTLPPLLARFRPGLVFYLAGCDPAADDAIGDWRITPAGMLARDRFVADQVRARSTPLAITLAGGYGKRAWTYSARFFAWLISGRVLEPPANEEMTLTRYRAAAARIAPHELTGGDTPTSLYDWGLSAEDIAPAGGMRARTRFLGYYTRQGLELALERSGLLDQVRAYGFSHLTFEIELDNPGGETLCLKSGETGDEPLIELRARIDRLTVPDMTMLRVEWLLLQNPLAHFTAERPRLPGQQHPGLGCLQDVIALMIVACDRLHLDGIVFVASHYHTAAQGQRLLRFLSSPDEALFHAIQAALQPLPLPAATAALDGGQVVDEETGEAVHWRPMTMILPVSSRLQDWLDALEKGSQDATPRPQLRRQAVV